MSCGEGQSEFRRSLRIAVLLAAIGGVVATVGHLIVSR